MREIITTRSQAITNRINSLEDFTAILSNSSGRYVVGTHNIFQGKNTNTTHDILAKVTDCIGSDKYDSIGGWKDPKTGIYHVDANTHFADLKTACDFARGRGEVAIYDLVDKETVVINYK